MTQQMAQMAVGGGTSSQTQPQNAPLQLNRLQAADLISHPFHVVELDQPPPSIILPPNVSSNTIAATGDMRLTSRLLVERHALA